MIYKTIDLCAGIGGIRRGFEMTGRFRNVLSAEIEPNAAKTYEYLYGDNPLNDLTSEDFLRKVEQTDYDVLLAGFPCQAFSRVGLKRGFKDTTRGTIFFSIANIIEQTRPKAVFLENVENLIAHDQGKTIGRILEVLIAELGYRVIGTERNDDGEIFFSRKSFIRNTKDFGLPQNRPRAYIMAFDERFFGSRVEALEKMIPFSGEKTIFKDVHSILEPRVDVKFYMSSGYWETLKRHKERQKEKGYGFGYCVVNTKDNPHPVANTILATGGSGKERNLIYQPREGVAGVIIKGKRTPLNNEGIRVMTPTEWGRLQGFIDYAFVKDGLDNFRFPEGISLGQQYKQFGNSVSIPVIETMARFMLECFRKMNS